MTDDFWLKTEVTDNQSNSDTDSMEVEMQYAEIEALTLEGPQELSQGQYGNFEADAVPGSRSCVKTWYKWYKRTWGLDVPPFDLIRQGSTQDTIYTNSQTDFDIYCSVYDSVECQTVYSDTIEVDVQ